MNKKFVVIAVTLVIILSCAMATLGTSTYDVTGDPLVSLSYINEVVIPEIERKISAAIEGVDLSDNRGYDDTEKVEKEEKDDTEVDSVGSANEDSVSSNATYEVVKLELGDIITATEPCEIILRSGVVEVYLGGNQSGISDLTSGTELREGSEVVANHLLLIPRGDGRGFKVMSSEVYVMVRGGHKVENEFK